jgi:hypothetical protein
MIDPRLKAQLLALIDREFELLLELDEASQQHYRGLDPEGAITPNEQVDAERFVRQFDRLNDFRESLKADTPEPEELTFYVDKLISQLGQKKTPLG